MNLRWIGEIICINILKICYLFVLLIRSWLMFVFNTDSIFIGIGSCLNSVATANYSAILSYSSNRISFDCLKNIAGENFCNLEIWKLINSSSSETFNINLISLHYRYATFFYHIYLYIVYWLLNIAEWE